MAANQIFTILERNTMSEKYSVELFVTTPCSPLTKPIHLKTAKKKVAKAEAVHTAREFVKNPPVLKGFASNQNLEIRVYEDFNKEDYKGEGYVVVGKDFIRAVAATKQGKGQPSRTPSGFIQGSENDIYRAGTY